MRNDVIILEEILAKIHLINTSFTKESFANDLTLQDATIRRLEVIGEAVKSLSDDLKSQNPDIEWRKIAGLRGVLIHNYFGVDLQVVVSKLPEFELQIGNILKSLL